MHFTGLLYRAHNPVWSREPLSGEGAARFGGRFNRIGRIALYTSLAPETALREVNRRFPQSEYAADARLKLDLVADHLAGKEMEIGRHYQRMGLWLAADMRFRNVVEKFDTTSHTPEALYRLTESSLALGVPQEAVKYAAVLGANYPGSEWYERAYKLVGKHAEGVTTS